MIKQFRDQYAFLSNMFPTKIKLDGVTYNSSENIYQSFKTIHNEERAVIATMKPHDSKKYWQGVDVRNIKFFTKRKEYMEIALRAKFANSHLRALLVSTGDEELVEGNWWGDAYWGVTDGGDGVGSNNLGKLLMKLREEFKKELAEKKNK